MFLGMSERVLQQAIIQAIRLIMAGSTLAHIHCSGTDHKVLIWNSNFDVNESSTQRPSPIPCHSSSKAASVPPNAATSKSDAASPKPNAASPNRKAAHPEPNTASPKPHAASLKLTPSPTHPRPSIETPPSRPCSSPRRSSRSSSSVNQSQNGHTPLANSQSSTRPAVFPASDGPEVIFLAAIGLQSTALFVITAIATKVFEEISI